MSRAVENRMLTVETESYTTVYVALLQSNKYTHYTHTNILVPCR